MYNCAEYAPKCIENILSQSYKNWELWLVHGDSNDGTEQVCQKYEDQDERINNIFHIDGLVPARNVGYERATGDWIMYIDGDDWVDGDCLVEIMEAAKRYDNPDVVFWNCLQELDGRSIKGCNRWNIKNDERLYTSEECRMLSQNTLEYTSGIATAYSKLIKSTFAHEFDLGHNKKLRQGMEGVEFSLRVFYNANTALFLNKDYNHYRFNPNSLSKVVSKKNTQYIFDSIVECNNFINTISINRDVFLRNLYNRSVYALIAVAMSTYFHPNNHDKFSIKKTEFKEWIYKNEFQLALKNVRIEKFSWGRKVAIYALKMEQYWVLAMLAMIKNTFRKK